MKNIFFLLLIITLFSCNEQFHLKEGDLLFQDLDSSPLCDAIEVVTPGYKGSNFSHIGIAVLDKGTLKVLEAIPPIVQLTSLKDFLNKSSDKDGNPKVIVGRVKDEYSHSIKSAISFLFSKIGAKYDNVFIMNNDSYYCSELIYEAFQNDSIFELKPMTFIDPQTNDTIGVWKDYYTDLEVKIPQNKLGINPGLMSLSEKIDIIHFYGIPSRMKK